MRIFTDSISCAIAGEIAVTFANSPDTGLFAFGERQSLAAERDTVVNANRSVSFYAAMRLQQCMTEVDAIAPF